MKHGTLTATEVNTGGGSMVTIIESSEWNYILVTNDEAVGIYQSQEAFWDNEPALEYTEIKS